MWKNNQKLCPSILGVLYSKFEVIHLHGVGSAYSLCWATNHPPLSRMVSMCCTCNDCIGMFNQMKYSRQDNLLILTILVGTTVTSRMCFNTGQRQWEIHIMLHINFDLQLQIALGWMPVKYWSGSSGTQNNAQKVVMLSVVKPGGKKRKKSIFLCW